MAEEKRIIHLFVPGRLCLFGEHSDWAGMYRTVNADIEKGAAIVSGTEQGIYATAEKADKFIMCSSSDLPASCAFLSAAASSLSRLVR